MAISPLTIAQVEAPEGGKTTGDYYYRTLSPGLAMSRVEDIYVINFTNEHRYRDRIMDEADVLILKNICDPDLLPIIRRRRERGKPTIYELADDLCAIEPWNPVYFFYRNKENRDLIKRLGSCCDAMQFSVVELQKKYGYLNSRSVVFPNQISILPPKRAWEDRREVVVGWGGSHGHLQDMEEIARDLIQWISGKDNVSLSLMCSDPIWDLFTALPGPKKKRFHPGSLEHYYGFLRSVHIGLAPLKDTAFNRARSDVKFLEYAINGVVTVAKDSEPYISTVANGVTGFLYGDSQELVNILDILSINPELRYSVSKAARQYVSIERTESAQASRRIEFYRGLTDEVYKNNRGRTSNGLFNSLRGIEGAERRERHLRLFPTGFETLIHNGLVIQQVEGDSARASLLFKKAMNLQPGNYLPYLMNAFARKDPIDNLRKALSLNPFSIRAWTWLGEQYAKKSRVNDSLNCFNSAARIFPEYEVPYHRAASILKAVGRTDESNVLSKSAERMRESLSPPQ